MSFPPHSAFFKTTSMLRLLALAALGGLATQCQSGPSAEQAATAPGSPKLENAVAAPMPKFDAEAPIMRQLALLPPAERRTSPETMHRYQQLTRRFWMAEYPTEYLLKQAQTPGGPPNLALFAQQLAIMQRHWRILSPGLSQHPPMPPGMTGHLTRMQQVETYQQAALAALQADCTAQRPPRLDAATLAAQQEVKKILAPLLRDPAPMKVRLQ